MLKELRELLWTPKGISLEKRHLTETAVAMVDGFFNRFGGRSRMQFSEIPLLEIGNTIQLVGAVYMEGATNAYLLFLPGEKAPDGFKDYGCSAIEMSPEDWKACLRQSDLCETQVSFGEKKAIVRKCERNVDSVLAWRCFKRDGFKCCYCGRDDLPLTVDHLVLWEEGGPTIMENLLSSCKKCNRNRGSTPFTLWLQSGYYAQSSKNLTQGVRDNNLRLATTLDSIQRVDHIRSR